MNIQFKNRKKELEELKRIINSKKFELVILYGRRRIGKTALALEVTKHSKRLYFLATQENNLERFYNLCIKHFPEVSKLKQDFEVLFEFLKDRVDVIIIDEFQNMIKENKNIVSLFQAIIDQILSKTKVKLFLLGSSVSMISSRVLNYQSPLYGRRTASIKLKGIKFKNLKEFFPKANFEELMNIYGFADGIPFYLIKIDKQFFNWLNKEIEKETSFLKDEIDFLMRYEFEDVSTYKLILKAIAFGKTKINEIKDFLKIKRTDITPYIKNLIETDFIERVVPLTENIKSRKGRYFLKDNFLKFWFRFIYPNLSSIEEATFDVSAIKKEYNTYLGFVFEDVCKELIKELRFFNYTKLGKWWHKDKEIDILAINDSTKHLLACECKWQHKINAEKIAKEIVEKLSYVDWHNKKRKESLAIFAKSFSKRITSYEGRKVYCYDLRDLERAVKQKI